MRILVCGGRDFKDAATVRTALEIYDPDTTVLIEGGAKGADFLARLYAIHHKWLAIWTFPAHWERHGKSAGVIRNKRMLEIALPTIVVAFPGGKGTANMVDIASKAGVPVRVIE